MTLQKVWVIAMDFIFFLDFVFIKVKLSALSSSVHKGLLIVHVTVWDKWADCPGRL